MGDPVLVQDQRTQPVEGVYGTGDLVACEGVSGDVVRVEVGLLELLAEMGGEFLVLSFEFFVGRGWGATPYRASLDSRCRLLGYDG